MPEKGFKKWPWGEIRMAVASGLMSQAVAAAHFGVPMGSIAARSAREGWLRDVGKTDLTTSDPALVALLAANRAEKERLGQLAVDFASLTREECRDRIRNSASRAIAKGLEHMVTASGEEIVAKADKIKSLVDAGGKASGFGEEEQGKTLVVSLEFLRNLDPTQERVVEDSKVIELPDEE